jgi:hypothetical protein
LFDWIIMNTNDITIPGPDGDVANNDSAVAWEEIAPGRYMPRRVRGSCKGRVLG